MIENILIFIFSAWGLLILYVVFQYFRLKKKLKPRKNDGCDGYELSNCCGSKIVNTDFCSCCWEHCETQCYDCDDICEDYDTVW